MTNSEHLVSNPRQLELRSLRELEYRLGEDRKRLRELVIRIPELYKPFEQSKKPKPYERAPSNKKRPIDNPQVELKLIQRKILKRLLDPIIVPDFLYGAVKGRDIVSHAARHLGARTAVKMDIKSFFPNVTNLHVYQTWQMLGCSPKVAGLLTKLTTFERHLPQGAPTSSALANLYIASLYPPISAMCDENQVKPSAWVDDLTFSGQKARDLMEPTRRILAANGFRLSPKKREILGPRSQKVICGVRLGASELRAPKKKLSDIAAGIHKLEIGLVNGDDRKEYLRSLVARIRHIERVCPRDAKKLSIRLQKSDPSVLQRPKKTQRPRTLDLAKALS